MRVHASPRCGITAERGCCSLHRTRTRCLCYQIFSRGTGAAMPTITCIEDLRRLAHRKVPGAFIDYAESGSYAEQTLRANRADLERITLRQRVLCDTANRSTKTTILGELVALPLALAPIGLCGMQHGDGEILSCRAAQGAGIPFTLSTMSICSIEDVTAAVAKPFWFQVYVMKDRGYIRALIERAAAAKCSALVLTVDLQVIGQRHRDIKNGMTVPPQIRLKNILDIATKPRWAMGIARGKRKTFGNIAGHYPGMTNVTVLSKWVAEQFDPSLSWKDVEWIKSLWPGKLILKGILDVEDARIAVKSGAAGLVVSNHGGRQLDGAPACMSGRAYIYGLGAGGEAGVARAIEIMRNELDITMALLGVTRVGDINWSNVVE